jgi:carboxyl-terminal processing protease
LIDENARQLKEQRDLTIKSLNYDKFVENQKALDKAAEKFENLKEPIESLKIYNMKVDMDAFEGDTVKLEINEKWLKRLNKDIFIDEALNVISDMAIKA